MQQKTKKPTSDLLFPSTAFERRKKISGSEALSNGQIVCVSSPRLRMHGHASTPVRSCVI